LADDAGELEAEQRLHTRQHDARLGQHLADTFVQGGIFRHGLLTGRDCPLLMTRLQPPQILKGVPAAEGEKGEKAAGSQAS
jgi:hypothetical protein